MRKVAVGLALGLLLLTAGSIWGTGSASADNGPHIRGQAATTDACAGCHRAHTAQAANLLKTDVTSLCYTCHDGTQANTNVQGGVWTGTGGGALRGGGFESAAINTADPSWRFSVSCTSGSPVPGYPTFTCPAGTTRITFCGVAANMSDIADCTSTITGSGYANPSSWLLHINPLGTAQASKSRHMVGSYGSGALTVWGSGLTNAAPDAGDSIAAGVFECTSCHDPHGNGQYRILRPNPAADELGLAGAYTLGVTVPDACPAGNTSCTAGNLHSYTTDNYMNATYVTPTTGVTDGGVIAAGSAGTGLSAWCAQCHQRYLASGVTGTDSGDAIFAFRHTTNGSLSYNMRACNTCHVSHGSNAASDGNASGHAYASTVAWPDGTTTVVPTGNSRLLKMDNRGMCLKCHKR